MTTEATAAEADGVVAPEDDKNAHIPVQSVEAEPVKVAVEAAPEPITEGEEEAEVQADATHDDAGAKKDVPRLPDWAQKQIAKTEFERREALRRAKAAEEEVARLKGAPPAAAATPGATAADEAAAQAAAPAGGYGSQADFDAAVQAEAARREAAARAAEDEARFNQACNEVYQKGKNAHADNFDAAVQNLSQLGFMNREMLDIVLSLDDPAKALMDLGGDPDRASQIMALPLGKRAVELAKISITTEPKPAPTKLSNAPRPVATVSGSARVTAAPSDDDPDDVWFAKRNAEIRARHATAG